MSDGGDDRIYSTNEGGSKDTTEERQTKRLLQRDKISERPRVTNECKDYGKGKQIEGNQNKVELGDNSGNESLGEPTRVKYEDWRENQ